MDKRTLTLTIDNLAFERNDQPLFSQLHCHIAAGEMLQVRGANGSGKSTLLRILAGLLEPQQGIISWNGKSVFKHRDLYQQQLQYIGHQSGIKQYLTVYENIKLHSTLSANSLNTDQINTILQKINLFHLLHTQALHLSAGQLRRLSLARLLFNSVPLWILDEPATALDSDGQQFLTTLLQQHLTNGGMAILATHQPLTITENMKNIFLGGQHA